MEQALLLTQVAETGFRDVLAGKEAEGTKVTIPCSAI